MPGQLPAGCQCPVAGALQVRQARSMPALAALGSRWQEEPPGTKHAINTWPARMVFTVWLELILWKSTKQSAEAPNKTAVAIQQFTSPGIALSFPKAPLPAPIEAVNQGTSADAPLQRDKPPASAPSATSDTLRHKTAASGVQRATLKYKARNLYGCIKPLRLYIYKGFIYLSRLYQAGTWAAGQRSPHCRAPLLPASSHL